MTPKRLGSIAKEEGQSMSLHGQAALVTGASRGIGREIAVALAEQGAQVAVVDIREDLLSETVRAIESKGAKALALKADVAAFADVEGAVGRTVETFGHLDILVNNAGITRDGLLMRMKDEDWDAVLRVNLKGIFNGIKAASRPMLRQKGGRIVNIASVSGLRGNAGQANYAAAKAGVIGLTKTAAQEFASRGITVNAVAPGYIDTAMTAALPDEVKQKNLAAIPLGRFGTPRDIADAVAFLAGPGAGYITGQVLVVDGGMTM
jgi:3-oxoacyl-[acyl-carrier protein] reductase